MADVSYSEVVTSKLQAWAAAASRVGRRADLAAAIREMDDQLRADPETWGDPIKDLPGLRLTVYHRHGPLLIVKYAVHIDGSPVFVTNVFLRPGTDLYYAARRSSP